MKIRKMMELQDGWRRFNLNVGGFTIRGCRWHATNRQLLFPLRYDRGRLPHPVVFVYGQQVVRLRSLLESGQTAVPRDRRPCTLKVTLRGLSRERRDWWIFDFTVRGFSILGCRWQQGSGSIQLPVTYAYDEAARKRDDQRQMWGYSRVKKPVVCAYGAHILRLRKALEAAWEKAMADAQAA